MLSEQQAEMRTMKEQQEATKQEHQAEMMKIKQEQQTMKQEHHDKIRKLQTGAYVTSSFEY